MSEHHVVIVAGDLVATGGMDMANLALARHLTRQGDSVEVVAHHVDPALATMSGVEWVRVPRPLGWHSLGAPLLDVAGRRASRKGSGRVLVNGGNCQAFDVNWVHFVHAAYTPELGPDIGNIRRAKARFDRLRALSVEKRAIKRARLVIANSERTRRDVIERLGVDESRVRTIYLGTDPERFRPPLPHERLRARAELDLLDQPALVFIGGLGDRRKGFDTLFRACSLLPASFEAQIIVVGAGAELASWQERARGSTLSQRLKFLGFRTDVDRLLRACDAIVAPSRYEPYGLAVHEALCCGLPAIVSSQSGVSERLNATLSELVLERADDAEALAALLLTWAGQKSRFATAALQLSQELRERTWDVMAAEMRGLLFP